MNACFKYKTNDQWCTPKNIYDRYVNSGCFVDFNPLCINYDNSLEKNFECDLFCNPPFSNIEPFVDYMIHHNEKGYQCIMLLPVRSGTSWFRKIMLNKNCSIGFFTQRLHFSDKGSCPFDCMLVSFGFCNDYIGKAKFYFLNRDLDIVFK